jgi:glycosyltransferase involved in cell wall biosynthesis
MSEAVPRISVLMGVYNSAPFVQEACKSILQQSLQDFELVALDDGSSDDSVPRLRTLSSKDSRLRLIAREHRGLIATCNELVAHARAPLIAWMDSDDRALPERLALQIARFDADPELVCLGGAVLEIDEEGAPIERVDYPCSHDAIWADMQRGGAMRFPATMMRRKAVIDVGGFREPFEMGQDFDLFLRLMEVGTLANLPEVVLQYRQHAHNISRLLGFRWQIYRDAILALARERREQGSDRLQRGEPLSLHFPKEPPSGSRRWDSHSVWARRALASGFSATARKHARKALFLAPYKLASWKLSLRVLLTPSRS